MHMISKKDLSDAEMDTLTKSCSPTIVITANGEVQTQEEAIVYVKELDMFLTMKVLENTPTVLSLGKLCDENGYSYEWINGQKPHLIQNGIRIQRNTENFVPVVVPGLSPSSSSSSHHSTSMTPSRQERSCSTSTTCSSSLTSATLRDNETRGREDRTERDTSPVLVSSFSVVDWTEELVVGRESSHEPVHQANKKFPKTIKGDHERTETPFVCRLRSRKFWNPMVLQEFSGNLVDVEVSECRDSHASSCHEVFLKPTFKRREDLGKYSVYTNFPKNRNCEICKRTKITRAPCRSCNGGAVPRAEKLGDLITADHKVLSDNCESHRYAVVVQDLATQWIQSYPCKTNFRKHRSLPKFLKPERKPKVIYTDNSLEFGKACEDLSWNHCTSTPNRAETNGIAERAETNGIAERAVRRVKEGTSAVLLQSGLNESWSADSMSCSTYLRNVTEFSPDGKTPLWRTFWATILRTDYSIWFIGWVSPFHCEGSVKNPSI